MPPSSPAAALDVREVIELTAEVMFRRMATEHIDPLHEEVNNLAKQVQRLTDATLGAAGNDPLQKQIRDLDEKCSRERQRIWKRVDEVANSAENKQNGKFRERLTGVWMGLTSAGVVLMGAVKVYEAVRRG